MQLGCIGCIAFWNFESNFECDIKRCVKIAIPFLYGLLPGNVTTSWSSLFNSAPVCKQSRGNLSAIKDCASLFPLLAFLCRVLAPALTTWQNTTRKQGQAWIIAHFWLILRQHTNNPIKHGLKNKTKPCHMWLIAVMMRHFVNIPAETVILNWFSTLFNLHSQTFYLLRRDFFHLASTTPLPVKEVNTLDNTDTREGSSSYLSCACYKLFVGCESEQIFLKNALFLGKNKTKQSSQCELILHDQKSNLEYVSPAII